MKPILFKKKKTFCLLRESDYEDILFEMKTFCSKIFEYSSNEKHSGELTFVQTF